jgi:hypothetical protein
MQQSNTLDKKFWEELVAYFCFIQHGWRRKRKYIGDSQIHRQLDNFLTTFMGGYTQTGSIVIS